MSTLVSFLRRFCRELERDPRHARHFVARVAHRVPRFAFRLVPLARLAEVKPAQQLAHKQNIGAFDDLRPQRAVHRQLLERKRGPQIGKSAQRRANLQQSSLGPLVRRKRVEFVAAHRAQQNRIRVERRFQRVGRQRRSVLHNGHAADALFGKHKFVAAQRGDLFQHGNRFAGHFGADAVAGRD